MREILFRGKRVDNDEWVKGYYVNVLEHYKPEMSGKSYIVSINNGVFFEVIPESVGQFIGLTDNNGRKIFEGDIVKESYGWAGLVTFCTDNIGSCGCCVPAFDGSGFKAIMKKLDNGVSMSNCLVIGNIHDNPEIWEEDKQ